LIVDGWDRFRPQMVPAHPLDKGAVELFAAKQAVGATRVACLCLGVCVLRRHHATLERTLPFAASGAWDQGLVSCYLYHHGGNVSGASFDKLAATAMGIELNISPPW
jgi:hypothetical protein